MAASNGLNQRENWPPARLIPTAGIKGQEEQERRATSSLLAVMRAVPEFGHALLRELGAPKSPAIQTFMEVRFKDSSGKTVIPDGAIVCERGRRSWTCLVEVKTGKAALRDEQVTCYLDVARENGFDGVLTISNQITAASDESPVSVDKRKLGKRGLWHFSWWRVITEAIVQSRYRGVSDPTKRGSSGSSLPISTQKPPVPAALGTWATSGWAYERLRTTARSGQARPRSARSPNVGRSSRSTSVLDSPKTSAVP
jgi:hypothetical protein